MVNRHLIWMKIIANCVDGNLLYITSTWNFSVELETPPVFGARIKV